MAIAKSLRSSRLFRLAPLALAAACLGGTALAASSVATVPGMPPVVNPANMYTEAGVGHLSDSLDKFKVGKKEKGEVLAFVGTLKKDIVEK